MEDRQINLNVLGPLYICLGFMKVKDTFLLIRVAQVELCEENDIFKWNLSMYIALLNNKSCVL
jgi:hypothetical protein